MPFARPRPRTLALMGAASALALGLAGCKIDNRPLLARGDAPAYAAAPGADYAYALGPLDPAEAARVVPAAEVYDGYALAERAYAYDRVAWQAPPDYGFRYGDVEPWAWQTAGDQLMFAEPIDDGYRFYYYEPGEDYPYFVRDPRYGYAYGDGGVLSAVFDAAGALLGGDQLYGLSGVAGAYLNRGQDLRRTYYAEPRYALASDPVWYDRWEDRYPVLRSSWEPWMTAADQVEPWRSYRVSTGERELHAFDRERERRAREIAKVERKFAHADWKAAKREDKAWRKAVREDDRQARLAWDGPPPPGPAPRVEDRHGRDDHRGRGRGHDAEPAAARGVPAAAVVADNRGPAKGPRHDDHPGGGRDRAGGPDKGPKAEGGGPGKGGDHGGGHGGKGPGGGKGHKD